MVMGDGDRNELEEDRERMCACTLGIETPQSSPLSIQVKTADTKTATPSRTSISLPTLLFPHHATLQYIPTSHSSILTQYCTYIHHVCMYLPTQSPPLPSSPIYFNRPRAGTIPLRPPTPSRFPRAGAKRPQPRPARKLQAAMLAPTARLVRCSLCTARMYICMGDAVDGLKQSIRRRRSETKGAIEGID